MKNLILLIMFSCLLACSGKPGANQVEAKVDLMAASPPPQEQGGLQTADVSKSNVSRKLVKDGIIEFETADIDKTKSQITAAVSANKGYVSSDQENKMENRRSYTMTVRIPADKFDRFLASATSFCNKGCFIF